jgi:hypothetical protein
MLLGVAGSGLSACSAVSRPAQPVAPESVATAGAHPGAPTAAQAAPATSSIPPPAWQLGAHPLPRRAGGLGQVLPTPPELVERALPTRDILPPPAGGAYTSTVRPVPADVLARSTWQPSCPVASTVLRYLTMSFWGFDGRAHTGEMIVNASVADGVVTAFGQLFAQRFPLEEMRVTRADELTAAPTGDGNSTSAFVCRPARGQPNWSAHAYGLAIDVNPFCNPYTDGELVLPELASAYVDRTRVRAGMVLAGDTTVRAFTTVGWSWGGEWAGPKDRMHFTANGT